MEVIKGIVKKSQKLYHTQSSTDQSYIKERRRKLENKSKPERVKKLAGGPVEVVLSGVWSTLAEFKNEAARKGVFAHEVLKKIKMIFGLKNYLSMNFKKSWL